MRIHLLITFVFWSYSASAQTKPVEGFLLSAVDFGSKPKLTFFLPCEIDTTLSFEENIKMIKPDTLMRISNGEKLILNSAISVKNEMDGKPMTILPVEVIFGEWVVEARAPFLNSFVEYPIKMFNQNITSGYNEKKYHYIKHLKILKNREK